MFIPTPPPSSAWAALLSQLGALKKGCITDWVTELLVPFGKDRDNGRHRLAQFVWDYCDLASLPTWLRGAEEFQRQGHGTYSKVAGYFVSVDGRISLEQGVQKYFKRRYLALNPESAKFATKRLMSWFKKGEMRSVSLEASAASFVKRAARGWPWMVTTARAPYEYYVEAREVLRHNLDNRYARAYPGVLGTRGQPKGLGKWAKSRAIFGMSLVPNLLKDMLFTTVVEEAKRRMAFCALHSRAAVDIAVTGVLKLAGDRPILSIDFSNFDASLPSEVIGYCFDALAHWFHATDRPLVRWCQENFQRTGIFVPGDPFSLLSGSDRTGGVPSGSVLTNLIDSMANFWLITYAAHRLGVFIERYLLQGDDGVYLFSASLPLDSLAEVLLVECGVLLSTGKCHYGPHEVHYLQMVHHVDWCKDGRYPGIRPIMRVLNGMMSYERKREDDWSAMHSSLRWIQQVDNASAHPAFGRLCKWLELHDGGVSDALVLLQNNNIDLYEACRSLGRDGWAKVPLSELYDAPVCKALSVLKAGGEVP